MMSARCRMLTGKRLYTGICGIDLWTNQRMVVCKSFCERSAAARRPSLGIGRRKEDTKSPSEEQQSLWPVERLFWKFLLVVECLKVLYASSLDGRRKHKCGSHEPGCRTQILLQGSFSKILQPIRNLLSLYNWSITDSDSEVLNLGPSKNPINRSAYF